MTRLLVPLLVLASACAVDHTDLPGPACGMDPYSRLDPETLGTPLAHEEIPLLALDAASVNSLLKEAGFPGLPVFPHGTRVFRYRYTTQDRGREVEATAVLVVPRGPDVPVDPLPVTLFLHGTTGFTDVCAPSRDLAGQAMGVLFGALGYVAVLPDFIGLNGFGAASTTTHGYLVGEQVAIGSWDALRAGLKLLPELETGVEASNRVVVWGASQGGHAALFTELYAPYYAPEFEVPAVVAMVAPTALAPLVKIAVSTFTPPTIAFAATLASMRRWYGAPPSYAGVLSDAEPYRFASTIEAETYVTGECSVGEGYDGLDDHPEHQNPGTVYDAAFMASVTADRMPDPWSCYVRENSLRESSVPPLRFTPTLLPYADEDELVVTAPLRDEFTRLCAAGYRLQYLECKGADHVDGALWSIPDQIRWVQDRLDGKPFTDVCERHPPVCCSGTPVGKCSP